MSRTNVYQRITLGLLGGAICAATACEVGPSYQRPAQDMGGATFKSAATKPSTQPSTQPADKTAVVPAPPKPLTRDWWKIFDDPTLTKIEEVAVQANPSVQAAMARVIEARQAARITHAQFYPVITSDPSVTRSRSVANKLTGNEAAPAVTANNFTIPFDLSYEVDIWGRIRRSVESSDALTMASIDDFEVVIQTLEADLATDYFTIRSLDSQEQILRKNVADYRQQVSLEQTLFKTGLAGKLDVLQAQSLLDSTITQLEDIKRQRDAQEHAIAVLMGRPPSELTVEVKPLDLVPPAVPVGMPADLLRYRPDVAEAEQNLISASANIGATKALLFPTLNLTGAAGFESYDIQHAVDWRNRFWSVGPSLFVPIFEGGRLSAGVEQARARYIELAANYRSQVLTAIQDVEDSLSNMHRYADEVTAQKRAVESSSEYLRLSEVEYKQGLINYLTVIDAERTLLTNQLTLAGLVQQRLTSTVLLVKALGGGWDSQSQAATQPSLPVPGTQPTPKEKPEHFDWQ